jgi:parvulin-like peptidyl-prolyl isomerase
MLYADTERMKEAEAAFQAALDIYRQLVKANPAAYQPYVARTLNNLAILYRDTQRLKEAEAAYQEALDIRRQLAKANPAVYQPDVAETLSNLANLYSDTQRMTDAEGAYQEALDIYRQLAKTNPAVFQPDVAQTLSNLALLHLQAGDLSQAAEESQEAVSINRERWKANAAAAADDLATSLIISSQAQKESSTACRLASEAGSVAQSSKLRELASQRMAACPPPYGITLQLPPANGDSLEVREPEQVRLSEILIVTVHPDDPARVAEAQHKAEEVRHAIRQGGAFSDFARANSQGPTAEQGGDMGYFKHGDLARSLEELVFRMKVGDVSEVVRTKQGFLILQVTDRR